MKLQQLFCLVGLFSCANLIGMQKEQNLPQIESRKLTIIDLEKIEKDTYLAMSNDEKWELHLETIDLVRRYMHAINQQNQTLSKARVFLQKEETELKQMIAKQRALANAAKPFSEDITSKSFNINQKNGL